MKLCPKRKTDEEYIESVRRLVSRRNWHVAIHAGLAVLLFGMFWKFWGWIFSDPDMHTDGPEFRIMLGALAGVMLVQVASSGYNVLWALKGQRTERILLRLYDELKQYKNNPPEPDSQ